MRSIKTILLSLAAALLVSCGTTKTVPITGRQQSLMVSDGDVLSLSTQQYQEFMKTAKLSTNAANTAMVKRVGQNLATAVTNYLNANGMAADVQNFKWTFNLVENKEANAWCMPGGLICVYEGILPLTQDEPSLAIVLGHEIAHAVARHSAEQMSTQIKQQYGMQIGAAVLGGMGVGSNTSSIIQAIAAQGFNFKNLSYSRNHESEADHMGLIFAAMAGYDPQVAVAFWQRMAPLGCYSYQADPGLDARGLEILQGLFYFYHFYHEVLNEEHFFQAHPIHEDNSHLYEKEEIRL